MFFIKQFQNHLCEFLNSVIIHSCLTVDLLKSKLATCLLPGPMQSLPIHHYTFKNHKKKNTLSTFHVLGEKERITSEYLPVAQECYFDIIEVEKEVVPGKMKCKQSAKSGKTIESKANENELVTSNCLSVHATCQINRRVWPEPHPTSAFFIF